MTSKDVTQLWYGTCPLVTIPSKRVPSPATFVLMYVYMCVCMRCEDAHHVSVFMYARVNMHAFIPCVYARMHVLIVYVHCGVVCRPMRSRLSAASASLRASSSACIHVCMYVMRIHMPRTCYVLTSYGHESEKRHPHMRGSVLCYTLPASRETHGTDTIILVRVGITLLFPACRKT
jgi:hypothetical protein